MKIKKITKVTVFIILIIFGFVSGLVLFMATDVALRTLYLGTSGSLIGIGMIGIFACLVLIGYSTYQIADMVDIEKTEDQES